MINADYSGVMIRDGLRYRIQNGFATVEGFTNQKHGKTELVIPAFLNEIKVTRIKPLAFCNSKIKKLVLPLTLEIIEEDAFLGSNELTEILSTEPKSFDEFLILSSRTGFPCVYVGESAFCGCLNLKQVKLFQEIFAEKESFKNCSSLEYVSCLAGARNHAFEGCPKFTTWTLSSNADITYGAITENLKTLRCISPFAYQPRNGDFLLRERLALYNCQVQTPHEVFAKNLRKVGVNSELVDTEQFSKLEWFILACKHRNFSELELESLFNDL